MVQREEKGEGRNLRPRDGEFGQLLFRFFRSLKPLLKVDTSFIAIGVPESPHYTFYIITEGANAPICNRLATSRADRL